MEALQDLQQAIELNDNRAVYRSRLLLDADLAARSASLGRIYSDLGFQQLALVEGWKSVNTDPTNFSAHRFLADSYAVLPRHEIARVSELLQSQLLQPINITPIQPRLAESNLFLISAGGPGALSFNEFNPIFNRDRVACRPAALPVKITPGLEKGSSPASTRRLPSALGTPTLRRTGFASTSDQKDDIANAFVQLELTPQTSIQAEYRYRKYRTRRSSTQILPGRLLPWPEKQRRENTYPPWCTARLSPGSILLGSFIYQDADVSQRDEQFPQSDSFRRSQEKVLNQVLLAVELQHLFRSRYVNLTSGVGYFTLMERIDTTVGFDPPLRVP